MLPTLIDETPVLITTGRTPLPGKLNVPPEAFAVAILANGLGRGKHALSEPFAARLNEAGIATLTVDLLTPDEAQIDSRTLHYSSDSDFQAGRIRDVVEWIQENPSTHDLPIVAAAAGAASRGLVRAAAGGPTIFEALVLDGGLRPSDVPAGMRVPALMLMQDDPVEMRRAQAVADAIAGNTDFRIVSSADAARAVNPFFCDAAGHVTAQWLADTIR